MRRLKCFVCVLVSVAAPLLGAGCGGGSGGPEWNVVLEGLDAGLTSVWGTAADDVWAVGGDPGEAGSAGGGPAVLHFDGTEWQTHDPGTGGNLWWVYGFDGGPVFMGGENGTIVQYSDGSFEPMTTPGDEKTVFGIWGPAPDDVWAVGGRPPSGNGFVWRYDGTEWSEADIPAEAENASVFKVWGPSGDDVWLVGSKGLLMHYDGSVFSVVDSGTTRLLFTVHARAERAAAVGGLGPEGLLLEREGSEGEWTSVIPERVPRVNGVWLTAGGGWAVANEGIVLRRRDTEWKRVETGLPTVEALHAVWADPDGGVWAVGGRVLSPPLSDGVLFHAGEQTVPSDGLGGGGG